ncbi:adenylosuccinate lyase [Haploplasma axanthum]|nr:adenylosuccinate lyase [Haploplasma axanthum]
MIKRYQSDEFEKLWSDQNRYDNFLKVELAAAKAWMLLGLYDSKTYLKISEATFKLEDIYELEKETKHDVVAFTRTVGNTIGDEKKWIHYGLTSTDVVDSANALILREVNSHINNRINDLIETLKEKAIRYKDIPCIGRTHGIHAEVTSFGLKFLLWYEDLKRIQKVFLDAKDNIEVIKISGAVGNYAANTPKLEEEISKILNIKSANISTQVLQRDRHALYISSIALLGSELEKISTEIRHLSRTEVGEVSESFAKGQKGSSAMPHKKNPIASENISGLSRVLRGYVTTSFEDINLWHERDISHSSVERIILADATSLIDYMLNRINNVLKNLDVNVEKISSNIELTKGVVFSQHVLSLLIQKGMIRETAYDLIQKLAYDTIENNKEFKLIIIDNKEIMSYVTIEEIETVFSYKYLLRNVDSIYSKVLN